MSAVARLNATAAPVTGPRVVSNFDSMKEPAWGVKYDFATTLCHEARMVHKPGVTGKLKFPAMTVNNRLLLNAELVDVHRHQHCVPVWHRGLPHGEPAGGRGFLSQPATGGSGDLM